jgi:hypothetical protein
MTRDAPAPCAVAGLGLALLACAGGPAATPSPRVWSFEQEATGAIPRGFVPAETGGKGSPASWRVAAGIDPHDPGQVVAVDTRNTGSTFNLLLSDEHHPADLTLSVWLRPRSGDEDQGGGLVWRACDAANYYVARWNPLEDNVRLYTVVGDERTMLASADVTASPDRWHRLEVTARGQTFTVALDGQRCIACADATFPDAGRIGLWTKADAATLFDRLEISR